MTVHTQTPQNTPTPLQQAYDDGVCPDCGEPIPASYEGGEDCAGCGHVFHLDTDPGICDPVLNV